MIIAKNTGLSIGVGLVLAVFVFFGGLTLGELKAEITNHEKLKTHDGAKELFIPKSEADLQFETIKADIQEIKDMQQLILIEIRK